MAASSCSPSSSAVTIPIPGKSILKRPPPTQTGFLTRIKGFLPNQSPINDDSKPLKRAHFILPQIATVYPISSINPPSTPTLKDEKKAIEDREAERRKRIVRGNSIGPNETEEWWNLDKVESFYRECCASREEEPDPAISAALKRAAGSKPRSVDLSGVQLTLTSAAILSDVFAIEWGLRKLILKECNLDEHMLKLMLHAVLIPATLSYLSVASNKRLKAPAFRIIGAYVSKAKSLQFLDLSQNVLDKKSVEYVTASLTTAPDPGLVSLRLDDCSLRPAALEALARSVRTSSLRNISLRHNKINVTGAVALAIMIRDYPDTVPTTPATPTFPLSGVSSNFSSPPPSPMSPTRNLMPPILSPAARTLPPPRHPASTSPQTTYTPYIPRRRGGAVNVGPNPLSASGQPVPIITSNSQGGVTTRHPVNHGVDGNLHGAGARHDHGPSAALLDKVRALDNLPRLGALRTLDLRGNDLRGGISYIAQVLKRNRTLKVLNLSENKLDVQCLICIAEALKYNLSLETLDLSRNPCSGPALEGIQSLRTAFTLNTALKRLFLASTQLTSPGAIALAEFLPESMSLLHLDLTVNNLDIAGVMALSSGLKANHVMRCLDLNIPPGDEEFARMCRDILNSCVRNTEDAERNVHAPHGSSPSPSGRGLGKGVWGMIEESELAKSIRQGDGTKGEPDVSLRAQAILDELKTLLSQSKSSSAASSGLSTPTTTEEPHAEITARARAVVAEMSSQVQTITDGVRLEEMLGLCDSINTSLTQLTSPPKSLLRGLGLLSVDTNGHAVNGEAKNADALHDSPVEQTHDINAEPLTPRVDKGKARAEPEPEEPEKVLSPTFMISEEDEDDEDGHRFLEELGNIGMPSPTDRSRSWVEEEGEVFRRGNVLLGPEEMEGEFAGDELRRELLDAMVERPPPRGFIDEFGAEIPSIIPPGEEVTSASPPPEEPTKPPPRPYISRSRSSSAMGQTGDLQSPSTLLSPVSASKSPTSPLSPTTRPFPPRS
ncbi:hypothetical protein SERLA73DRAFT_114776 [Serpula lacrymans var. lacrymans S7.3]|uniref:RNI-like protein n=2 Tax=Serpula lacrymans var. lacrymans TaxID=341189 RepID=F8QBD7_SERL3|nr:uncharacterized protein SERLADRAFT_418228 [Serpula lacrymans var. lacrymans S7.9]EGN94523.1 hypothetical protein SERLA73DRAFT_114776 [Serpula lacrymans var. lacrymans S7.3]EGO20004.1 hypothetical protein SERLADRAFT_418228 [Serpula lacrymans var. lacrymans S7.9]